MKRCQAPLLRQRFASGNYDLVGRNIVGTFIYTTAAKKTFGHCLIRLVIQSDIIGEDMLGQRQFAASNSRFALKHGEGGAVLTTGAAFDTFF